MNVCVRVSVCSRARGGEPSRLGARPGEGPRELPLCAHSWQRRDSAAAVAAAASGPPGAAAVLRGEPTRGRARRRLGQCGAGGGWSGEGGRRAGDAGRRRESGGSWRRRSPLPLAVAVGLPQMLWGPGCWG